MPERPLNRTAVSLMNCLMKFGVSIAALIMLSLTKYSHLELKKDKSKVSSIYIYIIFFMFPLKEQP